MGDYITLEFFQSYTRTTYDETTTPTATEVEGYITESERLINEKTGRTWGLKTNVNELYDLPNYEVLLKNYPVIAVSEVRDGDGNVLTEGIDEDYIVDSEDFIIFNPDNSKPSRVYVDYTSGYTTVRSDAKRLALLYTIQQVSQSESTAGTNSKMIKVGPITIQKELGMQTILNLDSDIKKYERALRSIVRR